MLRLVYNIRMRFCSDMWKNEIIYVQSLYCWVLLWSPIVGWVALNWVVQFSSIALMLQYGVWVTLVMRLLWTEWMLSHLVAHGGSVKSSCTYPTLVILLIVAHCRQKPDCTFSGDRGAGQNLLPGRVNISPYWLDLFSFLFSLNSPRVVTSLKYVTSLGHFGVKIELCDWTPLK